MAEPKPESKAEPKPESKDDVLKTIMAALGAVVTFAGLVAIAALSRGFCLALAWGWFIVPFGAPQIAISQAIGVAMIFAFLSNADIKPDPDAKNKGTGLAKKMIIMAVAPWAWLGVAWIVHLFQ